MPGDMSSAELGTDINMGVDVNRGMDIGTPVEIKPQPNKHARHRGGGSASPMGPGRVEGLDGEPWLEWLIKGKDDPDFKKLNSDPANPNKGQAILQRAIRGLASRPDSMISPATLEKTYELVDQLVIDGQISNADAALWLIRIGDKHQELTTKGTTTTPAPGTPPPGFIDQLAEAIHGKHLSQDEKYVEMQNDEQWNNDIIQPINTDAAPSYYVDMTWEERKIHNIRIEVANDCYIKRSKLSAPSLEALSKEVPYAGLSTSETAVLDGVPGVMEAKSIYVHLLENDIVLGRRPDGSEITLRTAIGSDDTANRANGRSELSLVRDLVRQRMEAVVKKGMSDKVRTLSGADLKKYQERFLDKLDDPQYADVLRVKTRDAEQIAFNLLYMGNTFEALDSKWQYDANGKPISRDRGPKIVSELLLLPIQSAMKPLDSLIKSVGKTTGKRSTVGAFGGWAYEQTLDSNGGKEIELDDKKPNYVARVNIVPETKGNENKFWTVTNNGGRTLNAPECYPTKLVGSIWEETKAKMDDGTEVPLIDFMRRGVPIPWNKVRGENMWQAYATKLGKAGQVWDLLQGKNSLKTNDYQNGVAVWVQEVSNTLSEFELADDPHIKRWIFYASSGINEKKREPHIKLSVPKPTMKLLLGNNSNKPYLNDEELFFPWDGLGIWKVLY